MKKYIKKGVYNTKGTCFICKKEFMGRVNQKYCTKECLKGFSGTRSVWPHLSTGTVGAIQELRASSDLMIKGYEVYRALSPSSSCDLLALKDGKMFRFEVRTGYRNGLGKLNYPSDKRAENMIVVLLNEIIYIPNIPEQISTIGA